MNPKAVKTKSGIESGGAEAELLQSFDSAVIRSARPGRQLGEVGGGDAIVNLIAQGTIEPGARIVGGSGCQSA